MKQALNKNDRSGIGLPIYGFFDTVHGSNLNFYQLAHLTNTPVKKTAKNGHQTKPRNTVQALRLKSG